MTNVNYILGVDGGGTKTIARLINLTSQEQWQAASGPSSLTNDFTGAVNVLNALIDDLTGQAACQSLEVVAVFGLAGTDDSDIVTKLQQIFAHRFAVLDIFNDATTSAYGANNGGEVAVVALGTGSVGMRLQFNEQGKLTQHIVGGWGFLIGDEGGGAKLGYHSVQALVTEFQHFGYVHSQLTQAVARFINTKDSGVITRQAIAVWLANAKPVNFAQLSPLVTQHQSVCPVAKEIIINHVASVELLIKDTRAATTLPVVLLGGLAQTTQTLLSAVTKRLLINAKGDALDGACLLANIALKKHKLVR
ncbi:MAG: ATPase [Gammaproteobacteria bacterium]|nr:MAG: ATPase [Gammaproteobacteria bacterium]PHR83972.1 MAG: ATPase [Colwellia sp.]